MTSAFSKAFVLAVHTDAFSLRFGSVFETLRFQMSPLWKAFSNVCVFSVVVWTIGENASKSMRFQTKTHQCGRGLSERYEKTM